MYAIFSGGVLLSLCDKPRYVKVNEASGAYVEAKETEAVGVAICGNLYNLVGGTAIPDAPEATITHSDISEYVFRNLARIEKDKEMQGSAIVGMEDALCEQDAANDERMSAIENALCELDIKVNGGGEI